MARFESSPGNHDNGGSQPPLFSYDGCDDSNKANEERLAGLRKLAKACGKYKRSLGALELYGRTGRVVSKDGLVSSLRTSARSADRTVGYTVKSVCGECPLKDLCSDMGGRALVEYLKGDPVDRRKFINALNSHGEDTCPEIIEGIHARSRTNKPEAPPVRDYSGDDENYGPPATPEKIREIRRRHGLPQKGEW
ncbi:hypothetical protein CR969_02365 [Candidatus Saccharibacteria bacterium]|nr:MAG: hypothetical protein CR969_02365 [Candidatus Saccharibacteria bacterium]